MTDYENNRNDIFTAMPCHGCYGYVYKNCFYKN